MTLPERPLPRRRRQILDDETGDAHHFKVSKRQPVPVHEGAWVKNSIARFAALIRNIGGGK